MFTYAVQSVRIESQYVNVLTTFVGRPFNKFFFISSNRLPRAVGSESFFAPRHRVYCAAYIAFREILLIAVSHKAVRGPLFVERRWIPVYTAISAAITITTAPRGCSAHSRVICLPVGLRAAGYTRSGHIYTYVYVDVYTWSRPYTYSRTG